MKECPRCHTVYDDSVRFCIQDGHALVEKPEVPRPAESARQNGTPSSASVQAEEPSQPQKPPKQGGCMKKIVIGVIVFVVVLGLLYNHIQNAATYLRTEPNNIQATKAGGMCKVDIDYDGYLWTVNHKPDWVTLVESDDNFMLNVEPNYTGQVREGSITVQSGKLISQVVIRQNAVTTYIRASDRSLSFGKSGDSKDITIETDGCSWVAEYTNWMTVTKESDTRLRISCPSNSGDYRMGTITVKEDYASVMISVTQSGKCGNCHGNGETTCGLCSGTGGIGFGMFYSSCSWCGGRGKVTCGVCKGTGVRE